MFFCLFSKTWPHICSAGYTYVVGCLYIDWKMRFIFHLHTDYFICQEKFYSAKPFRTLTSFVRSSRRVKDWGFAHMKDLRSDKILFSLPQLCCLCQVKLEKWCFIDAGKHFWCQCCNNLLLLTHIRC